VVWSKQIVAPPAKPERPSDSGSNDVVERWLAQIGAHQPSAGFAQDAFTPSGRSKAELDYRNDPRIYRGGNSLFDRLRAQLDTQGQYLPSAGFGRDAFTPSGRSEDEFDNENNPRIHAGANGLVDRLRALIGAQNQYQPSAGFGPEAPDANPPVQNAPIAVGDYMMPRIGSGFPPPRQNAQPPDAGVLPGNPPSQPQLRQPAVPQSPSPAQGALDGLGDHLMAGYQNLRQGGGLTGSITAAPTGQRKDLQTEEQQQAQMVQQRYLALKNAGIPDQKALLAAIDPEYRKMIVRDAFSSNQDLAI